MRRWTASVFALVFFACVIDAGLQAQTVVTDDAGRRVEVPAQIERIMAAGPPASVLLYVLAPRKMVGWVSEPTDEQKPFITEATRELPAYGRIAGRGGSANVESVIALKPDLIIDVGTVDETYVSLADRIQTQTGIPYILIDGRFRNSARVLREVGKLIGEEERGEQLAKFADDALARLNEQIVAIPAERRPRVYYGRGAAGLETGLSGSINMEVLDAVGAVNVAQSAGSGGLANVSVEQILAWNPDVIIAADRSFQQQLTADPQWASLAAVQSGRIFRAPSLPFGWFDSPPGVNRLVSVFWLSSVLYPDHAAKSGLRKEVVDFYRLFYHVEPSDAQLDTLLAGVQVGR